MLETVVPQAVQSVQAFIPNADSFFITELSSLRNHEDSGETIMSAIQELELLQKKKAELENEWTFLDQKEQAMKENARRLVEKVAALLAEKKEALEKLEYALKELEKKMTELQANRGPSEPITLLEKEEESQKQAIVVAATGN